MPACLLSHPNSLMVSPACSITSFFTTYSLYLRLREALCNHTAPQSSSSCNITLLLILGRYFILTCWSNGWFSVRGTAVAYLVTIHITVKRAHCRTQATTVRTTVSVSKVEDLRSDRFTHTPTKRSVSRSISKMCIRFKMTTATTRLHQPVIE